MPAVEDFTAAELAAWCDLFETRRAHDWFFGPLEATAELINELFEEADDA